MKKKEIIGFGLVTLFAISYFAYHITKIEDKKNIFLEDTVKIESLGNDFKEDEIIQYNDTKISFSDLPTALQKKIRNEQILAHLKINKILKEYIISYHLTKAKDKDAPINPREVKLLTPLRSSPETEAQVEAIYEQNKAKFPKDHNPEDIKRDLFVKIISNKIQSFYQDNLSEIYLEERLTLPDFPQLPENWFELPTTQSYGSEKAKNHLIWIGSYDDVNSKLIKEDIGQLVKKYTLEKLRVSFIPYTNGLWSASQFLNLSALCVKELKGDEGFWRFHTTLLDYGKDLVTIAPQDILSAEKFVLKILKSLSYSDQEIIKVSSCGKDQKSDLFTLLIGSQKVLEFLPERNPPMFFLNGRLIDIVSNRLLNAVNHRLENVLGVKAQEENKQR